MSRGLYIDNQVGFLRFANVTDHAFLEDSASQCVRASFSLLNLSNINYYKCRTGYKNKQ